MTARRFGTSLPLLIAFLSAILSLSAPSAVAEPLKGPFERATATFDANVEPFRTCPRPPPPVANFSDVAASEPDPNLFVSYELRRTVWTATRPIREFSRFVTGMADAYFRAHSPGALPAQCAARWIEAWARGGAFLGEISPRARYDTLWFGYVSIGVAYLKTRSAPSIPAATHVAIRRWLAEVARAAIRDQSALDEGGVSAGAKAWTAAAAAVAAVAVDDRELFDFAVAQTRMILGTVTADGAIPGELSRRARAFSHHVWALEPLALTALIAERNGVRLASENNFALRRVVDFVFASIRDSSRIDALSGASQRDAISNFPQDWTLGAFEIFLSIETHADAEHLVARRRPVSSPLTGGDWSHVLGRRVK